MVNINQYEGIVIVVSHGRRRVMEHVRDEDVMKCKDR